jgi:hypothetical protein
MLCCGEESGRFKTAEAPRRRGTKGRDFLHGYFSSLGTPCLWRSKNRKNDGGVLEDVTAHLCRSRSPGKS